MKRKVGVFKRFVKHCKKWMQEYEETRKELGALGIFSDLSGWGQYGHLFTVIIEKDKEKLQDVSSRSTEEQRDSNNKLSGK